MTPVNDYYEAVKTRRTYYDIEGETTLSDEKIENIVKFAVKHTPTSFNAQGTRAVLCLNKHHDKVWEIVKNAVRNEVSEKRWPKSKKKLEGFQAGYGTVLFFDDKETLKELQDKFPLYADKFAQWNEHSQGMMQHIVWTALVNEGMGASLQHYNPLIDEEIRKAFGLGENYRLVAQMPFGKPTDGPKDKSFKPIDERVHIFK